MEPVAPEPHKRGTLSLEPPTTITLEALQQGLNIERLSRTAKGQIIEQNPQNTRRNSRPNRRITRLISEPWKQTFLPQTFQELLLL